MRPIFCGNFEYDARQSDLERLFTKFGRVERVDMKSGFSWDLMEELLRVLFHACDKVPLLSFKKSHSNPQCHGSSFIHHFPQGIFFISFLMTFSQPSNSDMFQGFAFIYMKEEIDVEDAIRGLDRTEFGHKGCRLRVEWTKHERGVRRPEGGGGGSRRSVANTRPSKTLFVINFDPYHTRTRDLERHFESYGKIVNVRIRRNFAFVQYDSLDDVIRALEATNMRVISVEYAVRDDDDRRNGYTETRGRSPERGRDRWRSSSPNRRERGNPDYGRGSSCSPYRKKRESPDYGRGHSLSHHKRDRGTPEHGHITSRSPPRRERAGSNHACGSSRSPPRRERAGLDHTRGSSRSPYRKERASPENNRGPSLSPYMREKQSAENDGSPLVAVLIEEKGPLPTMVVELTIAHMEERELA
ncbi:Serine/arginine-rich splicing factor RS41 [Hibiscus syriacus]|uniref:Serine/arginine-rich splicing factor RS41 n=1 Tax=Hibiscus syriacus TaxID=106335 RepID=A0A6A3AN46_HIBSY|nr:Serine/arginine-rich splicing factor RS41 [Hibiscus syriacus]